MKSLSLVAAILLLLANISTAQTGTLTGKVTDDKDRLLAYATVLVFNGDLFVNGARADTDGVYTIAELVGGDL